MINFTYLKKTFLAYFLVSSIATILFAQDDIPSINKTFLMPSSGSLYVESSNGSVIVEGSDREDAKVMAYVRYEGKILSVDDAMLSELRGNINIIIEKNGSSVKAKAIRVAKGKPWNQVEVSFTVYVPNEMSCELKSTGGGINVSGVLGIHHFESNGGLIIMDHITGATTAESSKAGIKASNQKGSIRMESGGGGISLTGSKGDVIVRTSSGGIRLEKVDGRIDAISNGGALSIMGVATSVVAESSGGGISIDISGLTKKVELKTSGGGIDALFRESKELGLDLDLKSRNIDMDVENFLGTSKKDRVDGLLNGGGIPVYMRASGGSISVKFQ
ncbi:MAG: hypothetical protein ACJA2S_003671 [Cyclobacteriaceae bacterium]|jgi:hypothetical protein